MSQLDYDSKLKSLLQETSTYTILSEDPTEKIEGQCNRLILKWKKKNFITSEEATTLTRYNSICSRIYGKPKIHKANNPLRPIVSMNDAPTYNLSKMFVDILNNINGKTKRSVRNASELRQKLKKLKIPKGYVLVSLDVVSLFTKIPSELVYSAIEKKWTKICKFTKLPKDEFLLGLKMVMENCVFQYKDAIYKQIFGSPMGSPGSPCFADLVMEILEEDVIKRLPWKLPFFFRYVDDILTAIPVDKKQEILKAFNDYDENIQFTMEVESNNAIAFLDLLVIRTANGTLKTDWFHKETWSGRYLNFNSSLPFSYKRNTIKIITDKILELSDPEFHEKNFQLLKDTLVKNGYPKRLINDVIEKTMNGTTTELDDNNTKGKEKTKFVSIPYIKGLFEKIRYVFKDTDTEIVGRGGNNLGRNIFSKLKSKIPKEKQSNVVYNIPCCLENSYVGETGNRLGTRTGQHDYNIKVMNSNHSALCKHAIKEKHTPKFDQAEILFIERNQKARQIKEMIAIKQTKNNLNLKTDTLFLSTIYNDLLGLEPESNSMADNPTPTV